MRERLDEILNGRVGIGPKTQVELDALIQGGDDRYKEKIPPGFADIDKDKNPNEATFNHDHLKYSRKFGDLILWRQLLEHTKIKGIKEILFVTADKKEDWWWREQGKTIGAHPELVREIQRVSGAELFWMYSSVQFVEHANKYTAAAVSSESVAELQQVALSPPIRYQSVRSFSTEAPSFDERPIRYEANRYIARIDHRAIEHAVGNWLIRTRGNVEPNPRGFPDFLVHSGSDLEGFEVKHSSSFDKFFFSPAVMNAVLRGYLEMKEGRLSAFTLVAVIPELDFFELMGSDRIHEVNLRIGRMLRKYPITEIVLGGIIGGNYEPLLHRRLIDIDDSDTTLFDDDS